MKRSKQVPAKETKEETVNVRCTTTQKTRLETAAATEGMGVSTWLLRLGLVEADRKESHR